MVNVKCILGTVVLSIFSVWTEAAVLRTPSPLHEWTETLELSNLGRGHSGAFRRVRRNVPCSLKTSGKWPRSKDGNVYVPYFIDDNFSSEAKAAFVLGLVLFHLSTCIRFMVRTNELDYLLIQPSHRCRSFVGYQGGAQTVTLKFPDCFEISTIQHELLHALGFHHEHNRWDRDRHIRVLWKNIRRRDKCEFKKRLTLNQGTPYDYDSVMHYSRLLGSKNGLPTMEAVEGRAEFGTATEMSQSDIERVNSVYCSNASPERL
uniref:Metalloendopeptidase n=1 Tax=Neogobius melanostomus TaxID=47308 RepID=A0A8C6WEU4_9GOBI